MVTKYRHKLLSFCSSHSCCQWPDCGGKFKNDFMFLLYFLFSLNGYVQGFIQCVEFWSDCFYAEGCMVKSEGAQKKSFTNQSKCKIVVSHGHHY